MLFAALVGVLDSESFPETTLAYDLSLFASISTLFGAMICFLRWLHLAVRTANALGHDVGTTPGWAVGAWFVPILGLWLPYRTIRALLVSLGGEQAHRQAKLGPWWAAWIAYSYMNQLYADVEEASPMGMLVISAVVGIGTAVAAVNVVRTLTAAASRARETSTGAEAEAHLVGVVA